MSQALQGTLFCVGLAIASITDIKSRTIPYSVCILIAAAGLFPFSPVRLWGLMLSLPFFLAAGFHRGGAGDGYLVAASAFSLGLSDGAVGLILGLLCFVLFAVVMKCRKQEQPVSYPLAPFLAVGFAAAYFML